MRKTCVPILVSESGSDHSTHRVCLHTVSLSHIHTHILGVGGVQHTEQQLDEEPVEVEASPQEALVQQPGVGTGLAANQFLQEQREVWG